MSDQTAGIEIVPTCVARSIDELLTTMEKVRAFAPSIHIDVDDGVFTPESSWPFSEKSRVGEFDISKLSGAVFDVHLMVSDAREIGEIFIKASARSVIAHIESFASAGIARDTFKAWHALGAQELGLAILLDTPLQKIEPLLPYCDFIHVLSVATIGSQGASFDRRAIERLETLHQSHPILPLSVDGGVSLDTVEGLVRAGARRLAVGSAIMQAPLPAQEYERIKTVAERVLATIAEDRPL